MYLTANKPMATKPQVKDLTRYAVDTLIKVTEEGGLTAYEAILIVSLWECRTSPDIPDNVMMLFDKVEECASTQGSDITSILGMLQSKRKSSITRTASPAVAVPEAVTTKATDKKSSTAAKG